MKKLILSATCLLFAATSYAAFDSIFIKNNTTYAGPALECYEVGLTNRLLKMCNLYCGAAACDTEHPMVPRAQCNEYKAKYERYARLRGSATQIPCDVYKSKPYRPLAYMP